MDIYSAMYVTKKFRSSFADINALSHPTTTATDMCNGDRVKLHDPLLNYLRDFFNTIYHGQKIPKVFDKVLIEIDEMADNIIRRLYVTFPEEHPEWVIVDIFQDWTYVGKVFHLNETLPDSCRDSASGRYNVFTPALFVNEFTALPLDEQNHLKDFGRDVFEYVYLFIQANRENPYLFKEEEIPSPGSKKNRKKKHGRPHPKNPDQRNVVHVPKRRIYTLTGENTAHIPVPRTSAPQYRVGTWEVSGHTRHLTRNDGTVVEVPVKPYTAHRKKPLAPGASVQKPGTDYILHERPLK